MIILTIDFGTTVTKVGLWSEDGLVALTRAERPVTVAVEVLEMVMAHPPSVPGVTWL